MSKNSTLLSMRNSEKPSRIVTIIPFADDREWIKEPMLAKARQFAERYADIADKPAFAAFVVEHFGARYDSLIDSVILRFNLQRSRATLILRHAGHVLSEYYRQRRAQRAGSKKYTWYARDTRLPALPGAR